MSIALKNNIENTLQHLIDDKHFEMLINVMLESSFKKKEILVNGGKKNVD